VSEVNELSNTIDLPSTLIRAEALYNRFQKTVEAVDRKNHFPVPSNVRQRRPDLATTTVGKASADSKVKSSSRATPALLDRSSSSTENVEGSSSGTEVRLGAAASSPGKGTTVDKGKRKSIGDAVAEGIGATKEKVISPELRDLLRKDVYYALEKGEVKKHGGGV
jgi:TBC1 domain family member 15